MARPTTEPKGFIPAPGVCEVDMLYQFNGEHVENVYHVMKGAGGTGFTTTELESIAAAFENWESAVAAPIRNANSLLDQIIVRDLTSLSAPAITHFPVSPIVGGVSGVPLPGGCAVAVKWNTGLRGRSFRGRTFHFGMTNGATQGNVVNTAFLTQIVAAYNGLKTRIDAVSGMHMVVLSFAANKFWRDAGLPTLITTATADNSVDSQRRRLQGRGT